MEPKKIKNPTGMLIMHGTVIAVVLYMAWQLVRSYRAGGAEAPSLTTLIVGLVLLVGGCVVVGWLAVRLFLQAKREEKALEQETEQLHAAAAQENRDQYRRYDARQPLRAGHGRPFLLWHGARPLSRLAILQY